mgnify:CR=1 FL=1
MVDTQQALNYFATAVGKRQKRAIFNFEECLDLIRQNPQKILRNIFQLFYDLVKGYVGGGKDEYPDDPESIGFVQYDCSKLFVEGADNPFFADRLFANRFVRQIETLRQGFQQNRIYAYDGPSGCGKSTFLNNLLHTFETYANSEEGRTFEIIWEIEKDFFVPCPSHDYPILIIPKKYRAGFLERLFTGGAETTPMILKEKQYEWIFRNDVCTICRSILRSALERLHSFDDVLNMMKVRPYHFDRRLGEGISIFNPGDGPVFETAGGEKKSIAPYFTNKPIQEALDRVFGPYAVRYIFSSLAKTNNGIYVLMDIKGYNRQRLLELHNVISEGVHKVSDLEEPITSLFIALMNPEDKGVIEEEKMESFKGRIHYNKIPYVLEPATEANICTSIFGESVKAAFLPRILENFVTVIIASRMKTKYDHPIKDPLKEWIPDMAKYKRYCDKYGLLLRMAIYSGAIPDWLSEEDKKKFTAPIRRILIAGGENEGDKGFSGRDSLRLFNEFFNRYSGRQTLINMGSILEFFKHKIGRDIRDEYIPEEFLASLTDFYDYTVLQEVKESLYFYNEAQIAEDILHYLWAIDYDVGTKMICPYTGKEVEVTKNFLKFTATCLAGKEMTDNEAERFAQETQKKSVTVRAREGTSLKEMELYRNLTAAYRINLKENVLQPYIKNENFRDAVKSFGTPAFETFDSRLREHVAHMVHVLTTKFGYTEQGAKEICLYVLDKDLNSKFAS